MRSTLALGVLMALVGGCDAGVTHSAEVAQLAEEVCDAAYRCCDPGEAAYVLGPFVTPEDCADRVVRSGELSPVVVLGVISAAYPGIALPNFAALDRALSNGDMRVDGEAFSACVDDLRTSPCPAPPEEIPDVDAPFCPRPVVELPEGEVEGELPPCLRVFVGNVAEGGACDSALSGGLGGLLGGSGVCVEGHVCRTSPFLGVEGECVRLGVHGDYCAADADCGEDLYCAALYGSCQPFRLIGETCAFGDRDSLSPSAETALLRCAPELDCDHVTDTCVDLCERGASCSTDEQCDAEKGLSCVASRCDALRAAGLPCADDEDCQDGLRCGSPPPTAGVPSPLPVCLERFADETPCTSHVECQSEFCAPSIGTCTPTAAPGGPCPSGLSAECGDGGLCDTSFTSCTTDEECPGSRTCDVDTSLCNPGCVSRLPDGAMCTFDAECGSDACVAGFCGTPPFVVGEPCSSDFHCESGFCGLEDDRVCEALPLAIGARCSSGSQCETEVCFGTGAPRCVTGAGEGEPCGAEFTPCEPDLYYCDTDEDPPSCTPLRETGSPCESDAQCRGSCVVRFGRRMCDAAAPPDGAVCDGSGVAEAGGES